MIGVFIGKKKKLIGKYKSEMRWFMLTLLLILLGICDHFRCETLSDRLHPNKDKVKKETTFCDKCFEKNASVNNLDFSINIPISLYDDSNFGKIRYERTTKPMVKKALEKIGYETTRVIRRIGEIEEILTLICEIYRYIILNTEKFQSSDYCDYYVYCLEQYRDNY